MSFTRTAVISALLPLLGLAATAGFNRAVDPYRIFPGSVLPGDAGAGSRPGPAGDTADYAAYPSLHANLRLHKRWQTRHRKPDTLVLGTSKAIQGIPMRHAWFADGNAYNLGVPLASMQEINALLDHALANAPVRRVVLMLDILSFNLLARRDGPAAGFAPDRLDGPQGTATGRRTDLMAALLSFDALRASVATLLADPHGGHRVLNARGGRDDADMRSRLADGGHRDNAIAIERFFLDTVYLPAPAREYRLQAPVEADRAVAGSPAGTVSSAFTPFERLLRTAHARTIDLHIIISPSHARLTALQDLAGLQALRDRWKRRLVRLNERVAKEASRPPFPLTDASLPNAITTEPFPPPGDAGTRMRGYYESVHFNQDIGARILDGLDEPHPTIGEPLNRTSIRQVLQAGRRRQAEHMAAHPDDRSELQDIIDEVIR